MYRSLSVLTFTLVLSGCATSPQPYTVKPSNMRSDVMPSIENIAPEVETAPVASGFQRVPALATSQAKLSQQADIAQQFTNADTLQLAVNELPLPEFIQLVFAQQLGVNYILADGNHLKQKVTLNLGQGISSRQLFLAASQLLAEQKLSVTLRDNVYYIHPQTGQTRDGVVIGLGRNPADVPDTANKVLQLVPLRYGVKTSLERTIRSFSDATITADMEQNAFFIEASRTEVLRVIDLINLLDIPSIRGRHIAMVDLTFINVNDFTARITELLQAEGISAATRLTNGTALLLVPLPQTNAVALFTGDEFVLQRAEFWASKLDKPAPSNNLQYFIYHPRYASAGDLGASLAPLIGGQASQADRTRDTQSAQEAPDNRAQQAAANTSASVVGRDVRLTIDERSNSLVFHTRASVYQALLPIVQRFDVLPKQIVLDATIAEVTLTDEFAQGFEFAFRSGRLTGGTAGALGVGGMGGFNLNWGDGVSRVLARLSASTSLVNILSNPTIVVRDGVAASIAVGNDVPTAGATTINPGTETESTSVVYRKTGVRLNVTPKINAQGLVVLQIDKQISNVSTSGPQLAGSSSIFERSIQTEVIAQSGQTVLLGGLISENNNSGTNEVPGLASIPGLGVFFKGKNRRSEKTELVVFITPRIIDSLDQWPLIRARLAEGLKTLELME